MEEDGILVVVTRSKASDMKLVVLIDGTVSNPPDTIPKFPTNQMVVIRHTFNDRSGGGFKELDVEVF